VPDPCLKIIEVLKNKKKRTEWRHPLQHIHIYIYIYLTYTLCRRCQLFLGSVSSTSVFSIRVFPSFIFLMIRNVLPHQHWINFYLCVLCEAPNTITDHHTTWSLHFPFNFTEMSVVSVALLYSDQVDYSVMALTYITVRFTNLVWNTIPIASCSFPRPTVTNACNLNYGIIASFHVSFLTTAIQ